MQIVQTLTILNLSSISLKLLGNTVAQSAANAANGILRNTTIAVPLKYLSNFWRSLKIPLLNCKVELKLGWTKYCVFSVAGTDNVNGNDYDNIILTIKRNKIICLCINFISKMQSKIIKTS